MNRTDLVIMAGNRGGTAKVLADHGVDLVTAAGSDVEQIIRGDAAERLHRELVDAALTDLLEAITIMVAADEPVNIRRFGKFDPRSRKAVTRLNPATQEPIPVPAKRSIGFVPSPALKERLNRSGSSS